MCMSVTAILQVLLSIAAGVVTIAWLRGIRRADSLAGWIAAAGVAARLLLGAGLFWVSYLDWSRLAHLHSGDGFWELALDAHTYFLLAADAAEQGPGAVAAGSPSPAYVHVLALWMRMVGVTPPAAVLLNGLLAAGACRLIVAVWGSSAAQDRAMLRLLVTGFSCSPALILFSAQVLKDQFFVALLVLLAVSAFGVLRACGDRRGRGRRWMVGLALAIGLIAGVRPYMAFLAWIAFVPGLALAVLRSGEWRRRIPAAVGLLLALWGCFMVGAGAYYDRYGAMAAGMLDRVSFHLLPRSALGALAEGLSGDTATGMEGAMESLESARTGFVRAGGATNVADRSADESGRDLRLLRRTALGLTTMLVPITALQWLGVIEFAGGRGLTVVTDLDSLFNLAMIAVAVWLMTRRRTWLGPDRSYLVVAGLLLALTSLSMAYVVTNFGTLFRLRIMVLALVLLVLPGAARRGIHEPERAPAWP